VGVRRRDQPLGRQEGGSEGARVAEQLAAAEDRLERKAVRIK
jgi:hypothetical protein